MGHPLFLEIILRVDAPGLERTKRSKAEKRARGGRVGELVAGEKIGARVRRQHRKVAARADKEVHPASQRALRRAL